MSDRKEKYLKEESPFALKGAQYSIFFMKRLQMHQQKSLIFIVSTIDLHLYFLTYDSKLQNLHQDQTEFPVCQAFLSSNQSIYLGLWNGDILVMNTNKKIISQFYRSSSRSNHCQIQLLYERNNLLFAYNLEKKIEVIDIQKGQLKWTYQLPFSITSTIALFNPYSKLFLGCVSFTDHKPPILFDCDSIQEIEMAYATQISFHEGEKNEAKGQIIQMAYEQSKNSFNRLVCGSTKQTKLYWVQISEIQKQEEGYHCYPVYKFEVDSPIKHLSINFGALIIISRLKIFLIEVNGNRQKANSFKMKKDQELLCWGFIAERTKKYEKLILSKGFDYLLPKQYTKKEPSLHVNFYGL